MGNETILYYVTQDKILGDCNVLPELLAKRAGRKKIWQKERLPFFMVEQDNLTIYTILIPTKGKKWKPEKLLRLMQNTQETWQNDFAKRQIVLQQDIAAILHWDYPIKYWAFKRKTSILSFFCWEMWCSRKCKCATLSR